MEGESFRLRNANLIRQVMGRVLLLSHESVDFVGCGALVLESYPVHGRQLMCACCCEVYEGDILGRR